MTGQPHALFISDTNKPKHGQIQDGILRNIYQGIWSPGDRIPPERSLAKQFKASVGTVRHALQFLVNQGYLQRTQGKGTFVTKSVEHSDTLRYFRFASDFVDVVQPLTIQCLSKPKVKEFPEAAEALGLKASAKFYEIKRMFKLAAEPLVYVISYLPRSLFPNFGKFSANSLEEIPLYLLVENKYSMPTLSTKERFSAVIADKETAGMLKLEMGAPVLKIQMLAITTRQTVYEYQVSYCNTADRQIFRD